MRILVTGAAGFIGSHLINSLDHDKNEIYGVDSFSDYYSPELKQFRIREFLSEKHFKFEQIDLSNREKVDQLFRKFNPEIVFHFAAQAGIRISLSENYRYIESNLLGFSNVLTASVQNNVERFLYASSSSVYGNSPEKKFSEQLTGLEPVSFYGATKLANEVLANALARNSQTSVRGLRFFTVYGPWGRPDMAYFRIVNSILNNKSFPIYGDGSLRRDFTFIGDTIQAVNLLAEELLNHPKGFADVVNVGGGRPYSLSDLIRNLESLTGSKVQLIQKESVKADANYTIADTFLQQKLIRYAPQTLLSDGLSQVLNWARIPVIQGKLDSWANSTK